MSILLTIILLLLSVSLIDWFWIRCYLHSRDYSTFVNVMAEYSSGR